jgi:CheY-like chemotaxis protein
MGGNVWVESRPGAGSTFSTSIPFKGYAMDISETEAGPEGESWPALPPLRILLVEDQKMNQLFTVDLLSCQHHEVEVAENGSQALEMLTRTSYDLVLMDMKMPVMDGLEAATQIRMADHRIMNPDIPIIGLSAHAATDDEIARFQNAGFDVYIVKPVQFDKLFEAMKSRQMLETIR